MTTFLFGMIAGVVMGLLILALIHLAAAPVAPAEPVAAVEAQPEAAPQAGKPEAPTHRSAQKPFRTRRSQSEIAANWELRQTDAFKHAAAKREKQKEQNHGNDHKKR